MSSSSSGGSGGGDVQGSGGLGRWWIASALLVAAVAAGLVLVLMRGNDSGDNGVAGSPGSGPAVGAASPGPSSSSSSSSSPAGSDPVAPKETAGSGGSALTAAWPDVGCNGVAGPVTAPAKVMLDVTWTPFLTAALPTSPTIGPRVVSAGSPLRQCFQHSPAGALMAAANIVLAENAPTGAQVVVQQQILAGPGRDKALRDLVTASHQPGQIVGYRLGACTAPACNVDLVAFAQGVYAVSTVPMVWTKGDWFIDGTQALPDGGLVPAMPAGFTGWGPGL